MTRGILAAIALCLAAVAVASEPAQIYGLKCGGCHRKDGRGSEFGKKLGVPDLTALTTSEAEIARVISMGKGKMSGYADRLTPAEIEALAAWVKRGLR